MSKTKPAPVVEFQSTTLVKRECLGCGHPVRSRTPQATDTAMLDHLDRVHNEPLVELLTDESLEEKK